MSELAVLREANEAAKLANETAMLQAETAAVTGMAFPGQHVPAPEGNFVEAFGDRVSYNDYPAGERDRVFGLAGRGLSLGADLGDRARGQNPLLFDDEHGLAHIRSVGRLLCDTSVNARCVQENLTSYILGTGYQYKAVMQDGVKSEPKLIAAVQQVVNEFLRENHWNEWRHEELFKRKRRDGEQFLPLYHIGGGHVQCRILEPEQITEPATPRDVGVPEYLDDLNTSYTFGVVTPDNDMETVFGYCVHWRTPEGRDEWKWFGPSTMVHIKRNVDSNIKRGVSDFWAVYEQLTDAHKLARNTARGHAILSAIAFIREHAEGVSQSQAETLRSNTDWSTYRQQTRSEGSRTRYTHYYQPGTIIDAGRDTKYKASPLAEQGVGSSTQLIEDMILRLAGTNWCMPAYMISGAGDANYASTLVTESPFVKYCQRQQVKEQADDTEVLWKVVAIAFGAGRFDKFVESIGELQALVNLKVEVPIVHSRDRNIETNRRKVLHDDGVISTETWAAEEGYDYEKEIKEGAKRQQQPGMMGDRPGQPVAKETHPQDTAQPFRGKPQPEPAKYESRLERAAKLLWESYPAASADIAEVAHVPSVQGVAASS